MTYEDFQIHPLADKFPLIKGAAFDDLVVSIEQRGLLEPIVMLDGQVIDGRNRLRACIKANVEPKFSEYSHAEIPVEEFIWTVNVDRRHLTDDQRVAASMAWEEFEREQAKERQRRSGQEYGRGKVVQDSAQPIERPTKTRDALAMRAGVSTHKVEQARAVKRHDEESGTDLLKQVESGEMELRQAVRVAATAVDLINRKRRRNEKLASWWRE